MYVKQKGRATELAQAMDDSTWQAVVESPLVLLHTRAATQGSPNDNVNNHPVVGHDWLVTHNGIVHNDDHLFRHFAIERPAAVDTVAINLVLGQGRTVEESLAHACTLRGSASVAAIHTGRPGELVLFRIFGSPVYLYWIPTWSMLVWSSDRDGERAVSDISHGFAGFAQTYELPESTALHLTPAGLKRYALTPSPFGPSYYYSGGSGAGGSRTGFLPQSRTTRTAVGTATTATKTPRPLGQEMLAILRSDSGLLEQPIFQGSRQEYHHINRYDGYIPDAGSFVLPTGYGRWFLTRTPDGPILREFKPHKRVRLRWEQEFNTPADEAPHYTVTLPATGQQQDDLSDLLCLGHVDLVTADQPSASALMCPWCGVLRHHTGWKIAEYRCEWCQVASLPPKT